MTHQEAYDLYVNLWWDVFVRVFPTAITCAGIGNDEVTRIRARKEWEAEMSHLEYDNRR